MFKTELVKEILAQKYNVNIKGIQASIPVVNIGILTDKGAFTRGFKTSIQMEFHTAEEEIAKELANIYNSGGAGDAT